MRVTAPIQRRFDTQHRLLDKMYDLFGENQTQEWMSIHKAIELLEEPEGAVSQALRTFDDLGILRRDTSYPDFQKQKVDWTLVVPKHEAKRLLDGWHEKQRMSTEPLMYPKHVPKRRRSKRREDGTSETQDERPHGVAVATEPAEEGKELRASAGPEATSPFEALRPLRKDESKAVVAAARQYANKARFLEQKINELRAEGFEVAEGALSIKRDERMENIALAVPYIESLERENERLLNQHEGARRIAREHEDLMTRYTRLKRSYDEMIAKRVNESRQQQQQAVANG